MGELPGPYDDEREVTDDELFNVGLFDLCLTMHMAVTGASDGYPPWLMKRVAEYLTKRVESWSKGNRSSWAFDTAVKLVVVSTINEYRDWCNDTQTGWIANRRAGVTP